MSEPLAGIRVLECAEGIPGPTAGWLLREAGAEVLKVEKPEGDRLRASLGFHVLNRGKRAVVLDLGDEAHRDELRRLLAAADVVIADEIDARLDRLGLGYDPKRWPSLVWCAAPLFGRRGPRAGLPPDDGLALAASGIAVMQWSYGRTPVHLVTPIASYATGFLAALGVAAALVARTATGKGQRVDTSGLAGAMLLQSGTYVRGSGHEGSLASQAHDPRGVFPTYGLYATADGWIFVGALTEAFWTKLAVLLGRSDLLADADFAGSPLTFGRVEVRERLRRELEPMFAARPTDEWLRRFEEADVPIGRVQSRRDYLDEPTAAATGAMIEIEDPTVGVIRQAGAPVVFDRRRPAPPEPAPELDPDARPTFGERRHGRSAPARRIGAPLEGHRVLDLTSFIAGPLCPMLLADLGADVVKVESPDGDPFRIAAFGFEGWNRGKRSLALDLKKEAGRAAFLRLAARADAVVENFRPGTMERLGLGFEELSRRSPRLVYTAISGFGADGPEAHRPGFDPVMQARSGLCRAQGGSDEPVLHQVAYTDYMSGTLAAFATTVALFDRTRTGQGRHVDASLHRTAFAIQAAEIVECAGVMPEVGGGRDLLGTSAVHRAYPATDGWIFIAVDDRRGAAALVERLSLRLDPRALLAAPVQGPEAAEIERAIAGWRKEPLAAELREAGVPAAPCLGFDEVFEDAHLREDGLIVELDHPRLGRIAATGAILRFSATPMRPPRPSPALGEHGREALREAGLGEAEIARLVPGTGPS